VNGEGQLGHHGESVRQAAAADRLVITKTDLVEETVTADLTRRLRALNPFAPIVNGEAATVTSLGLSAKGESAVAPIRSESEVKAHDHARHRHDSAIKSFVVTMEQPIDWTAFGVWLTMLLNRHGEKVLRVKGILNLVGESAPVAVHGVQRLVHPPVHMKRWPDADRRSRIVFIVEGLDPALIRRSLAAFNRIAVAVDAA